MTTPVAALPSESAIRLALPDALAWRAYDAASVMVKRANGSVWRVSSDAAVRPYCVAPLCFW